jgi:hypothetical protein
MIMTMDDERYLLAPRKFHELACAGACFRFVFIIDRKDDPRLRIKLGRRGNGINRKEHRPGLR